MGYRERRGALIAKRAAPHLEPGEQIQTGFIAQTGRWIFTVPVATFVATDRAILHPEITAADEALREMRSRGTLPESEQH